MWAHNACSSRQCKRQLMHDEAAGTVSVTVTGEAAPPAPAAAAGAAGPTPLSPSSLYVRTRAASQAIQQLRAQLDRVEQELDAEKAAHAATAAAAGAGADAAHAAALEAERALRAERAELVKVHSAVVTYLGAPPGQAYNKVKSVGRWLLRTEERFPGGMYALAKQMRFMESRFGKGWEGSFERRLAAMEEARKELDIARSTTSGLQVQLASAAGEKADLLAQLTDAHEYAAELEELLQTYQQGAMDELMAAQHAQISGYTGEGAAAAATTGSDEDEEWLPGGCHACIHVCSHTSVVPCMHVGQAVWGRARIQSRASLRTDEVLKRDA